MGSRARERDKMLVDAEESEKRWVKKKKKKKKKKKESGIGCGGSGWLRLVMDPPVPEI